MAKVYRPSELEELDQNLLCRAFECPQCGGSGEVETFFEGNDYSDICPDCDGEGVLLLKDCRPCEFCGQKIYFQQIEGGKWQAIDADTDDRHQCGKQPKG